jgi:hydrogenase expression/formation protein HypE
MHEAQLMTDLLHKIEALAHANGGARVAGVEISLDERAIPVGGKVRAMCELLGLDPIYVANEGRLVAPADAGRALRVLRGHDVSNGACVIGEVSAGTAGRVVDMLSGKQLPRTC